jgi:PhzF family phenazine biosynthesis protein
MKTVKLYQVDAFAERPFTGNPAAVCFFDEWPDDSLMQSIAMENNLAETAFIVSRKEDFEIRWFTPAVEVDLCGHATLASAYVLFNCLNYSRSEIVFRSPKSGVLKVSRDGEYLFLDFPADELTPVALFADIEKAIGIKPLEVWKGKFDYLAVLPDEESVLKLSPNLGEVAKLKARGLIVTAAGNEVDFVSRFFAPQSGINEDPVTGSAHTSLIPLWSAKLGKNEMTARQLSQRGGYLLCHNKGSRMLIGGKARLYLTGEIVV